MSEKERTNPFEGLDLKNRYESLKLSGYNDDVLPIKYFDNEYVINRKSGIITLSGSTTFADSSAIIAITNLLLYSKENPVNSNVFVPIHQIKQASGHTQSFTNHALKPFAKAFDGKLNQLIESANKLGFTPIKTSDAGFLAYAFSCIPVQFLFWDGDDEFPAQANILFDENVTDFIKVESILGIAMDGVKKLVGCHLDIEQIQ